VGWLVVRRNARDRRIAGVSFTEVGLQKILEAVEVGVVKVARAMAQCFAREASGAQGVDEVVAAVFEVWWRVARHFLDRAIVLYAPPRERVDVVVASAGQRRA